MEFNASEDKLGFNRIIVSGNELDLLADYYFNDRKFNKNFYSDKYNLQSFELDGKWQYYLDRKEVQKKKEEDRLSYFVDEFVKREVLYRNQETNLSIATALLSLSRFERRIVGQTFFDFALTYKDKTSNFIGRRYGTIGDLTIAFVIHDRSVEHQLVMNALELAVEGFCVYNKYQCKKILGIAFSNELAGFKYAYLDNVLPFEEEYEGEVLADLKIVGWFTDIEYIHTTYEEYPK